MTSNSDPSGYFARKWAREEQLRAAAPYTIDGSPEVIPNFEALIRRLENNGHLVPEYERRADGTFLIRDAAFGYGCGRIRSYREA
jgi:hypothetical protein